MKKIMMKWEKPELETLNVAETAYGGSTATTPDYVYQNADGYWEATFEAQS